MANLRLNIGAGETQIPGFLSVDIKTGTDASGKLPYRDGEVAEIYASHVLEHIHHSKTGATLEEWVRVLQPGGRIRIAVPDYQEIARQIASGEMAMNMASAWTYGSRDDDTDRHQATFSHESLELALMALGIDGVERWEPEYNDCSRLPLSLNLGGRKRQVVIKSNPKVSMVLSTSRFGPTDFYKGVCDHCTLHGWKLHSYGGDNWAKALTGLIKKAIAQDNPDYIVTLDFDSCFDASETYELLKFMQDSPDVAAAWSVQAHRHNDLPLGFAWEAAAQGYYDFTKENPWAGRFTKFGSGHFGCTIIRRQVFDTMPQPWLAGLPSPNTHEMDEESLDNDISFWLAMNAHGFVYGQLNTVQIGHMELCAKWIVGDKIMWQPIQHFRKHGRPKNAVFDGEGWVRKARLMMAEKLRQAGAPPEVIAAFEKAASMPSSTKEVAPAAPKPAPASAPELIESVSTNCPDALELITRVAAHEGVIHVPVPEAIVGEGFEALAECDRLANKRELAHANGKV